MESPVTTSIPWRPRQRVAANVFQALAKVMTHLSTRFFFPDMTLVPSFPDGRSVNVFSL